jgi:dephospho-CoA kinase
MTRNKNIILGVTGVSGSGQTTVTGILKTLGAYAVIADELAHQAILKSRPPYEKIIAAFGTEILDDDLEIDRQRLGARVFGKPELLKLLEDIIHPYVIDQTENLINEAMQTGLYRFAVIDAPMLIESGMNKRCGRVWLVTAPDKIKIERIMKRDNITREAATTRIATRNEAYLADKADEIINNDGSIEQLKQDVEKKLRNWLT